MMAHLDPIELGGIGLALLVVYRALILLQDVITRRVGAPRRSEGSQPRIRIGDPVPVTTAQCETYRERTTERMDAMEQRIMGRLDDIRAELGRIETGMVRAVAAHERRYHTDVSGMHDLADI